MPATAIAWAAFTYRPFHDCSTVAPVSGFSMDCPSHNRPDDDCEQTVLQRNVYQITRRHSNTDHSCAETLLLKTRPTARRLPLRWTTRRTPFPGSQSYRRNATIERPMISMHSNHMPNRYFRAWLPRSDTDHWAMHSDDCRCDPSPVRRGEQP